jgi:hypothetical protein
VACSSGTKPQGLLDAPIEEQLGRRGFNLGRASSLSETRVEEGRSGGLQTLRLDGCSLRAASLDAISRFIGLVTVRTAEARLNKPASGYSLRRSNLKNLSIRRNRINATGAVALALIIRDYPDNRPVASAVNSGVSNGEGLFSRLNQEGPRAELSDATDGPRDPSVPSTYPSVTNSVDPEKLGPLVTLDIKGNEIRVSEVALTSKSAPI